MTTPQGSIFGSILKNHSTQGRYPKIQVKLKVKIHHSQDANVEFPNPEETLARVNIIHRAGLIGEYDWLNLRAKDLNKISEGYYEAEITDFLVPPLLLPPSYYQLHLIGMSYWIQIKNMYVRFFPRLRVTLIDESGVRTIRFEEIYTPPQGGHREIGDKIMPQILF